MDNYQVIMSDSVSRIIYEDIDYGLRLMFSYWYSKILNPSLYNIIVLFLKKLTMHFKMPGVQSFQQYNGRNG